MPSTAKPSQRNFNAGVLTGWMAARADLDKFRSGMRWCMNFLLTPFGPLRRRMGLKFVNATKYSGARKCTGFGFQASTQEGYFIELGHLYMRFHRNGLPVLLSGSPYEIATPWTEDQIHDVQYESVNDVTFLVHPDVPIQLLRYFSETDWEIEPMELDFPPTMTENFGPITLQITAFTDVPIVTTVGFAVTDDTVALTEGQNLPVQGDYEVVVNSLSPGAGPGEEFALQQSTDGGQNWTNLTVITAVGSYTGTFTGNLRLIAKFYEVDASLACTTNNPQISEGDTITVQSSAPLFTADMVGTYFSMTHARPTTEVQLYMRSGETLFVYSEPLAVVGSWNVSTTGIWAGELTVQRSRDDGSTWEKVISFVANKDRNITYTGAEKVPCLLRLMFIGGDEDSLYATLTVEDPNQEGVFKITQFNNSSSVDGVVIVPFVSQDPTTIWKQGSWGGASGYPRTVQWHANRMVFGGTRQEPGTLWFSVIEDYYNFKYGTNDDSGFSKSLGGTQQEVIQWLASKQVLAIGTTGGEWIGSSPEQNVITPTDFTLSLQSGNGGARQQAVVANNTILFVQHTNRKVREFSYSVTDNSFGAMDLTQLCIDVTEGGITSCCLQRQRDTTFWATTGKGKLISMIYERGQQVVGWTTHDTVGEFEAVGSVFESGEEDSIYCIIKRVIQGNVVRYVERMVPNQFQLLDEGNLSMMPFMDSFRTYDGTTTSPGFTDLSDFQTKLASIPISSNATQVNGYAAIKAAADEIVWNLDPGVTRAIIVLTDTTSIGGTPDQTAVLSSLNDKQIVLSQGPDFSAFQTNNYTSMVTTTGGATWTAMEINNNAAIFNAITSLFPTGNDRLEICFIIDKLATPADTINFQDIIAALKNQMALIDANLLTKFDEIGYSLMSVTALGYVFETVASPTMESIVTGLNHLIGETVQVLADGKYIQPDQVVTIGGTVTLPEAAAIVHIGLPYTSVMETLPVSIQLGNGDSTSAVKQISEINMRVYRSVSAETAPIYNYPGTWEPLTFSNRNTVDFDPEVPMDEIGYLENWKFKGHPGNAKDPRIAIRQNAPLPLNILEVQTNIEIAQ